jgi:hypothetical protein
MNRDNEFDGDNSPDIPLTAFWERTPPKRGRPKGIDDGSLWGARAALLDVLESSWGRIGWELQRAKTTSDIRAALQPLSANYGSRIDIYVRSSIVRAAPGNARTTQRQLYQIASRSRACYDQVQKCREKLERAKGALNAVRGTAQESEIETLCRQRQQLLEDSERQHQQLDTDDRKLLEHLANQQAYIAQTELLSFFRSRRYAFTPLNVANAMAGLPYMGWRQSAKRCAKLERPFVQSFTYQVFLMISRALKKSSPRQLLVTLERYLRKRPKSDYTAAELRKTWYYLSAAIQSVIQSRNHPKAIPYRIVAEYQRRTTVRSQLDLVLEEEGQLH